MSKGLQRLVFPRSQVRHNGTYPIIGIDELRLKKQSDIIKNASIPLRDYHEWRKIANLMKYETFFTRRGKSWGTSVGSQNDLSLYDPIVTHCIAKWLLVDYKLNSYPYHDLNIVNVYTDLRQSLRIAKTMMTYFKTVLSETMFERIRYMMVPLYDHEPIQVEKICQSIPGDVNLISDSAIFFSQPDGGDNDKYPFIIEDPVSIIMLNDVIKNLPHDLVKFSHEKRQWEQAYTDFNPDGLESLRFESDLDFWCKFAIGKTLDDKLPSTRESTQGLYIPTRLAQLFEMIKRCAPQHKFLAVDEPQRWNPTFLSMIKLCLGYEPIRGSKIIESQMDSIWRKSGRGGNGPVFTTDFTQIQQMYMNINGMGRTSEIDDLGEFVDKWVNLGQDYDQSFTREKLESQLQMINESSLAVIHS